MKTLNAYDEMVQRFITDNKNDNNKNYSADRMADFKQSVFEAGFIFDELFPKKQYDVLTKLLIKVSQTGITKIKATSLSAAAACGITTVFNAVKSIKKTNQLIVARLKSSKKNNGHYIFVDKHHANFKEIMKQVFLLDEKEIKGLNVAQTVVHNVGLKKPVNLVKPTYKLIKNSFKGFKGFKGFKNNLFNNNNIHNKSAIAAIKETIDQDLKQKSVEEQRECLNVYATNMYQKEFFNFVVDMPFPQYVKDNAYKLSLRVGSNCERKQFIKAIAAIKNLVLDKIANNDNVVRLFDGAFKAALTYNVPAAKPVIKKSLKPAPLFDWINERD